VFVWGQITDYKTKQYQWFDPKHTLDDDSCLVLQSVIWSQTPTWRWFLSSSVMSDLTSKLQTHIWQWFLSSSVINYLILKHTTVNDFLKTRQESSSSVCLGSNHWL
jgi:hypothetical protein